MKIKRIVYMGIIALFLLSSCSTDGSLPMAASDVVQTDFVYSDAKHPEAVAMNILEFVDLSPNLDSEKLLVLPCEVLFNEPGYGFLCLWSGTEYGYSVENMQTAHDELDEGDQILVYGRYDPTEDLTFDDETTALHFIEGQDYQKIDETYAYEPVKSDLTYERRKEQAPEEDGGELITYNFTNFQDNLVGRLIKFPCEIIAIHSTTQAVCEWKEAKQAIYLTYNGGAYPELGAKSKIDVYGFVGLDSMCFDDDNILRPGMDCLPNIHLLSYEQK